MESTSTLHSRSPAKAWQRKIREKRERYGLPPGLRESDLGLKASRVRPVTTQTARQIIERYEWLRTMAKTTHHYGIFFGPYCGGVACYGIATVAGKNHHLMFGIERNELGVLARGACVHWTPKGAASRLISYSLKLVASEGLKVIVAYADTDAGEIGTVYQATNRIYIGPGSPTPLMIAPNGRPYNVKVVHNHRLSRGQTETVSFKEQRNAMLEAGWTEEKGNPKHRYIQILATGEEGEAIREKIEKMILPYPKGRFNSDPCAPDYG